MGSIFSKGTWISSVRRVVMVTSPEPKRSAASAMAFCSSAVTLPLRVMTRRVELVGRPLIIEEAQGLHCGDLLRRNGGGDPGHPDLIEGHTALQHPGIGIAESLQLVLEEVAPFALGADEEEFGVLLKPSEGALTAERSMRTAPGTLGWSPTSRTV